MSISCALGLVACLTFNGEQFPKHVVPDVLNTCVSAEDLPASAFRSRGGPGGGVILALRDAGVRADWPIGRERAAERRLVTLRVCAQFRAAANNPRNGSR